MKRLSHALLLILSLALLSACAPNVALIEPGRVIVGEHLSVLPDRKWNDATGMVKSVNYTVWTREGLPLDQLRFYVAIPAGESLQDQQFEHSGQTQRSVQVRKGMGLDELADLVEAAYAQRDAILMSDHLAPAHFAGMTGIRLDFHFIDRKSEVTFQGMAYAAMQNDHLYLITFEAPKLHFYEAIQPLAQAIIDSAVLVNAHQ